MKLKVIKELGYIGLREILPLNYEFEIEVKLSTKEKVIHSGSNLSGANKARAIFPRVVAPIGNYEGFKFIGANGFEYDEEILIRTMGYSWRMEDYFLKI